MHSKQRHLSNYFEKKVAGRLCSKQFNASVELGKFDSFTRNCSSITACEICPSIKLEDPLSSKDFIIYIISYFS